MPRVSEPRATDDQIKEIRHERDKRGLENTVLADFLGCHKKTVGEKLCKNRVGRRVFLTQKEARGLFILFDELDEALDRAELRYERDVHET